MESEIDIWRLAAGLGLFLFGMHELEQSLKLLGGRSFKKFLREQTAHPVKGVFVGALSTAALQSSSVVSLIVMAFVGTGIVSLPSAIGIVFGSNLGTTATGWIVATLGFKLDIEALALPVIAIGGLGAVWTRAGSRSSGTARLLAGFGLMLLGLEFMKSGAIAATNLFDPARLAEYPLAVFLLAGLGVTALIQSSSATIMITLSALYAGAVSLPAAAAVAVGADLGTTITALLAALAGATDKRRLAVALVVFNVVTDVIAFAALGPLLAFVTRGLGITDPLYALVAFHSLFNLMGILLFLPAIGSLGRWLSGRFADVGDALLRHVKSADRAVPEAAIENISRETLRLIDQVSALNQLAFDLKVGEAFYDAGDDRLGVPVFGREPEYEPAYDRAKQLEGEILAEAVQLQRMPLNPAESARLGKLLVAVRNAVHAAKYVKDTRQDLAAIRESLSDRLNAWFGRFREAMQSFHAAVGGLRQVGSASHRFEKLVDLRHFVEQTHNGHHRQIHDEVVHGELGKVQVSTLLNVNRELYLANQSLLDSIADTLLDPARAADFESLPAGG